MGSIHRRPGRFEFIISACLLAMLSLIGAGVFIKQFDYDISQFGIDTAIVPKSETRSSKSETPFELGSLSPAGFEASSRIEVYNSENLYEKINGKAPFYIESGFEKLSAQRFAGKDDESLGMEIYLFDMGSAKNAFSVYSRQKRAGTEKLPAFAFAYRTSNALYFSHNRYYVELIGFSESAQLFEAMLTTAQKLRANLTADGDTEIAELALFPNENLILGSIKLYLANAFGFEGLTDTFTARYKFGDETVTAFLSRCPDSQSARTIADGYYNFLINNGGIAKPKAGKTTDGRAVDFYGTTEIIFTIGAFVAGIHEAENQQPAEKLATMLINKLTDAAKDTEQ